MRVVSTRVLPVPAPASTSTGPSSVSTARALLGVQLGEIVAAGGARTPRPVGNAAGLRRRRLIAGNDGAGGRAGHAAAVALA